MCAMKVFFHLLSVVVGLLDGGFRGHGPSMEDIDPTRIVRYIDADFVELDDYTVRCLLCPRKLGSLQKVSPHRRTRIHRERLVERECLRREQVRAARVAVPVDAKGQLPSAPDGGEEDPSGSDLVPADVPDLAEERAPQAQSPTDPVHIDRSADAEVSVGLDVPDSALNRSGDARGAAVSYVSDTKSEAGPLRLGNLVDGVKSDLLRASEARIRLDLLDAADAVWPTHVTDRLNQITGAVPQDFESDEEYFPPYADDEGVPDGSHFDRPGGGTSSSPPGLPQVLVCTPSPYV